MVYFVPVFTTVHTLCACVLCKAGMRRPPCVGGMQQGQGVACGPNGVVKKGGNSGRASSAALSLVAT